MDGAALSKIGQNIGAFGLVRGRRLTGENGQVTFRFFDIAAQREMFNKTYPLSPDRLRGVAHAFADEIVKYLTGTSGVFSTRRLPSPCTRAKIPTSGSPTSTARMRIGVTKNGAINLLPSWDQAGKGAVLHDLLERQPRLVLGRFDFAGGKAGLDPARELLNTGAALSPDGKKSRGTHVVT